jgi:two-component system, sensor histidine kinase
LTEGTSTADRWPDDEAELRDRVARQQLRNACGEVSRAWWVMPLIEGVVAGVLYADSTRPWLAVVWLLALQGVQIIRRRTIKRMIAQPPASPHVALAGISRQWAVLGAFRAAALVIAATTGSALTHLLVTTITVGLASGAIATSGGASGVMRPWNYVVFGTMATSWALQFTWLGVVVSILAVYLATLLNGYMRRLGEQGVELIRATLNLEHERDLLTQANHAVTTMAEQLRAERDRVSEMSEVKTRFLASASHDLRQPLYAMSLNTSVLSDAAQRLRDPQLDRIESGLKRALQQSRELLDQLLDISRLESGTVKVQIEPVDVGQLLQSMQPQYRAMAQEKGLQWQLECRGHLLAATDAALLERLVGNVLHNAVKFTETGMVGVRVDATTADAVRIEVHDSGRGIAERDHERVFEEFYQVDNPSRDRGKGIGLGLSIVRRLAELLDAGVALESGPGQGTRVSVRLPVSALRPRTPPATTPLQRGAHARRVLVIDDESTLLDDLRLLLEGRGWNVHTASRIDEALAEVSASWAPDVILADYRLAGDDTGLDAIRALHERIGDVPALIVTGDTAPSRIAEATEAGHPVLHKPIDGDELDGALHALCDQAAAVGGQHTAAPSPHA